jgi:hypothetical protein
MPWRTKSKTRGPSKPDMQDDFPEPGSAGDFLALMNELYPRTLDLRSWPRYRQGGHVRRWDIGGTHNYSDPNGFTQIGVAAWDGNPSTHHWKDVFMATWFSGPPIILCSVLLTEPVSTSCWCVARVVHARVTHIDHIALDWWSAAPITHIDMSWLAYGPGAPQPTATP